MDSDYTIITPLYCVHHYSPPHPSLGTFPHHSLHLPFPPFPLTPSPPPLDIQHVVENHWSDLLVDSDCVHHARTRSPVHLPIPGCTQRVDQSHGAEH